MGDKTRGLYGKFFIERTDGKSAPGEKHDGCDYFVLDLTHDPHALSALRAYADSCEAEYPLLAADLRVKLQALAPPTCPNCDAELPAGCGRIFINEQACALRVSQPAPVDSDGGHPD